jgi:hypothetical protein
LSPRFQYLHQDTQENQRASESRN